MGSESPKDNFITRVQSPQSLSVIMSPCLRIKQLSPEQKNSMDLSHVQIPPHLTTTHYDPVWTESLPGYTSCLNPTPSDLFLENNCVIWLPTQYDLLWKVSLTGNKLIFLVPPPQTLCDKFSLVIWCWKCHLTTTQYDPVWTESLLRNRLMFESHPIRLVPWE